MAEKTTKTPAAESVAKSDGFCVYIGPSVPGVIQSGTIFAGTKKDAEKKLKEAIKKYPEIALLLVTDKNLPNDRLRVKMPGNLLNVYYKKLAGKKEE